MIELFSKGNEDYSKNGDIVLMPVLCDVTAGLKDSWTLELEHQIDKEGRWTYITENSRLRVGSFNGEQLFTVKKVKKTDSGVYVKAVPSFMEAADDCFIIDKRPTNKTGQQALDDILRSNPKYSGRSNITKRATSYYILKNAIEAITNGENSFLERWGGEVYFDNYEIIINEQIGGDYGVSILYGKNIEADGISEEIDIDEVVTRIIPQAFNGRTLPGNTPWVNSPLINNYLTVKTKVVEYSNIKFIEDVSEGEDTEGYIICNTLAELHQELRNAAQNSFNDGLDKPKVTIKCKMILLQNTEEYKDYQQLESVSLGDIVYCHHDKLNITTTARVTELVWDCIKEKPKLITIGDEPVSMASTLVSTITSAAKISSVIAPNGSIMAERIQGFINGAWAQLKLQNTIAKKQDVRAILFEDLDPDSPTYGAMCLGTQGFQISRERTADGKDWEWTTAVTGEGIIANTVVTGLLSDKANRNYWNLDTGDFQLTGYATDSYVDQKALDARDQALELAENYVDIELTNYPTTDIVNGKIGEAVNESKSYTNTQVVAGVEQAIMTAEEYADALQNRNLTPFFGQPFTDTESADTPDAYWKRIDTNFYTFLGDGWAHFSRENTGSETLWAAAYPLYSTVNLKPDTRYTMMIEVKNVVSTGTAPYVRSSYTGTPTPAFTSYGTYRPSADNIYYSKLTTVSDLTTAQIIAKFMIGVAPSSKFECDIRVSLYEGDYDGKFQPYIVKLNQEDIFNILTDGRRAQGIFMRNGDLYLNATYINTGQLDANLIKVGRIQDAANKNYWDMVTGEFQLTGYATTTYADQKAGAAESAAKSYADGKASDAKDQALALAEKYVDDELVNYPTNTDLSNTLTNYPTNTSLANTLTGYPTNSQADAKVAAGVSLANDYTDDQVMTAKQYADALQNRNLTPYFGQPYSDVATTDTPNAYWERISTYYTYLGDGWSHFSRSNSTTSEVWAAAYIKPNTVILEPDTVYTMMIEVKNVTSTGTAPHIRSSYTGTPTQAFTSYGTYRPTQENTYYSKLTTISDLSQIAVVAKFMIGVPSNSSFECDIRVSLYKGEYSGPFQPYMARITQEDIFNILTDGKQTQGIFMRNGLLYLNATYINSGTLSGDYIKGGIIDGTVIKSDISVPSMGLTYTARLEQGALDVRNDNLTERVCIGYVDGDGVLYPSATLSVVGYDYSTHAVKYIHQLTQRFGLIQQDKTTKRQSNLDPNSLYFTQNLGESSEITIVCSPYTAGESDTFTLGPWDGYVSGRQIVFFIPTRRSPKGKTLMVTPPSTAIIRGVKGYINGTQNQSVSDWTWTATAVDNGLRVAGTSPTAFTNATDQTPINIRGTFMVAFS